MITITTETLEKAGCCEDSINTFQRLFPDGLTLKSEQEAIDAAVQVYDQFDWENAAVWLLKDAALIEYNKAAKPARDEYNKATATALDEYNKAKAIAWDQYYKAIATTFARAYWKQEVGE